MIRLARRSYYRWALALPFVLPLLLFLLSMLLAPLSGSAPHEALSALTGILGLAAIFGGIPYALTCGAVLYVMRRRPADAYRRLTWWLPVLFAPAAALFVVVVQLLDGWDAVLAHGLRAALNVAAWSLAVGYFYVALTHALAWLLSHAGLVAADADSPAGSQ